MPLNRVLQVEMSSCINQELLGAFSSISIKPFEITTIPVFFNAFSDCENKVDQIFSIGFFNDAGLIFKIFFTVWYFRPPNKPFYCS